MDKFKRIMALILVIVLILGIILMAAGCKKTEGGGATVKVTDTVVHTVPQGYTEKDYVLLTGGEGFDKTLEAVVGFEEGFAAQEYYDDKGECVGYYVIDEHGWVSAWEDFEGKTHKLADEDQFEINSATAEPAAFDLAGTVEMKFFMYANEGKAVSCYRYFILSNAADAQKAMKALQVMDVVDVEKVADNVLLNVLDANAIQDIFVLSGAEGTVVDFMEDQKAQFGVTGELPEEKLPVEETEPAAAGAEETIGETEEVAEDTEATAVSVAGEETEPVEDTVSGETTEGIVYEGA